MRRTKRVVYVVEVVGDDDVPVPAFALVWDDYVFQTRRAAIEAAKELRGHFARCWSGAPRVRVTKYVPEER